jgi:hypothetical protein
MGVGACASEYSMDDREYPEILAKDTHRQHYSQWIVRTSSKCWTTGLTRGAPGCGLSRHRSSVLSGAQVGAVATSLVVYQWRNRWAVPVSADGGTGLACRAFRAEVVDDPLRDHSGIPCAPVGAFHLRGFVGVLHVAELDEYCGVLRQIEAGEVSATIESV